MRKTISKKLRKAASLIAPDGYRRTYRRMKHAYTRATKAGRKQMLEQL
jgi:hypothetical protein